MHIRVDFFVDIVIYITFLIILCFSWYFTNAICYCQPLIHTVHIIHKKGTGGDACVLPVLFFGLVCYDMTTKYKES